VSEGVKEGGSERVTTHQHIKHHWV